MDKIFFIGIIIGILSRLIMLHLDQKQYPTEPNILLSQLVLAFVASALGSLLVPALIERSYTSITFLSLAAQQFRQVRDNRRDTLQNLEDVQLIQRGNAFIEEISSTYESRSYISLFSSLVASVIYIYFARAYKFGFLPCTILAAIGGVIVGFIFKRYLRRSSIGDIADVVEAKINFDGPILKVNDVFIENIGLEDTRSKYLKEGIAIEIIPKNMKAYGVVSDLGQRQAVLHNLFIHFGINKDIDEKDLLATTKINLDKNTVVIPYLPLVKDIDELIKVVKSTPILEVSKGKQSAYSGEKL